MSAWAILHPDTRSAIGLAFWWLGAGGNGGRSEDRKWSTVDGSSPQPASKPGPCLTGPESFMLHDFAASSAIHFRGSEQPIDALNLRQWTDAYRRRPSSRSASEVSST